MLATRWYVERSRSVAIQLRGGSPIGNETTFEGYQRVDDGGCYLSSGPCQEFPLQEPDPCRPEHGAAIGEALRGFDAGCGGKAVLRYIAIAGHRLAAGETLDAEPKAFAHWALVGSVTTPRGRRVSVGLSGLGNGLDRLHDPATVGRVAWTSAHVDGADIVSGAFTAGAVANPSSAGIFVHEAVGHFAEAEDRADVSHRLGIRVASDFINVIDDPTAPGGAARYEIDDEGVASLGPTIVVRDGVLVGQLHSLATARGAGAAPTANGRARSAWDRPLPRVSNLVCSGGTSSPSELLERLVDGLYIHQLADGFRRGTRIEARVVLAERVRGGKLTGQYLTGGRICESNDVLVRAAELGHDVEIRSNAMCGKGGQLLFDVGTCCPSIRFTLLRLST